MTDMKTKIEKLYILLKFWADANPSKMQNISTAILLILVCTFGIFSCYLLLTWAGEAWLRIVVSALAVTIITWSLK